MPESKRLFFGLLPPEPVREQFVALQQQFASNGSLHDPRDLHMTLVFIGMSNKQVCLETAASMISSPPFEIVIDSIDYWRKPRILLAGASTTPQPLADLVSVLNRRAAECDFTPERRAYLPHITLSRRSKAVARTAIEPIVWPVDAFRLFRSQDGIGKPRYRTLDEWALTGATSDADQAGKSSG